MSGRGFSMDYRPPCTSGPGMPGPYKAVQRQMGNRGKPGFFNYTTKTRTCISSPNVL